MLNITNVLNNLIVPYHNKYIMLYIFKALALWDYLDNIR